MPMNMKTLFAVFALVLVASIAYAGVPVHAQESCSANETACGVGLPSETEVRNPSQITAEPGQICIIYFYGEGCTKCAATEPFMKEVEQKYGDKVHVNKLEVYHNLANFQMYNSYCSVNNIPVEARGVPFLAISDKHFIGSSQIKANLEAEIDRMIATGERICPVMDENGTTACRIDEYNQTDVSPLIPGLGNMVSLPLVIVAGLADGINPCTFAVMIFLLTFLLEISDDRKRMVKAAIAYMAAVYMTYLLAGIGLLSAIQFAGASVIVVYIAGAVAVIAGAINIKDYFWYGKGFSLKIPESRKGTIDKWIKKANVPAALILGFLVSIFELPCTGGIYLAVIAMLANTVTSATALLYLIIYNIFYVIPLFVIFLLVIRGASAERMEHWRTSKKNWMKLAMGIVLIVLGIVSVLSVV